MALAGAPGAGLWLCGEVLWNVHSVVQAGNSAVPGRCPELGAAPVVWHCPGCPVAVRAQGRSAAPVRAWQEALASEQEQEMAGECLTSQCSTHLHSLGLCSELAGECAHCLPGQGQGCAVYSRRSDPLTF